MKRLLCVFIVGFLLQSVAISKEIPRFWPLQIGSSLYMRLELALTEKQREIGLMNRTSMPSDGGMIFVFEKPKPMAFWMKNTLIPLDILFLDANGKVVAVHRMEVERPRRENEPEQIYDMSLTPYPSGAPAQFAIELNAGQVAKCGIKVGQTVDLRKEALLELMGASSGKK